ncbi:vomeronasal type-2 receptor 116-like [Mus caroli]|uniref:Vomeronasal type-2 receptor 116-like n=1 Tax=Mus caroli TaxID=10089 RepID=A0A6P5PDI7_MUSCR|nr:vomeronasal type-2 receptor 116-like [Mus caroli]
MAPKDTSLALAMVSFILYFKWNWIGLVIPDDDQGNQFLLELRKESENKEICFAFVKMISVNEVSFKHKNEMYYSQIVMSLTNVIIIYGETYNFIKLMFRMWDTPILQRIWITTIQWNFPTSKADISHGTFYGSLTFLPHHGEISGFKNFVQKWFHLRNTDLYLVMPERKYFNYEDSASNCKILKNNSSDASFDWLMEEKFDMTFSESSHNIYNAVHAIAHALHEMNLQQADNQAIYNGKGASSHCLKVNSFLRRAYFTNPLGDKVFMKERVIMQDEYDIIYFGNLSQHLGMKMKLGKFSPYLPNGQHFHFYVDMIELATGRRKMPSSVCSADCSPGFRRLWKEGMAVCCFVCSPCPENEISNETNMDQCVNCPEYQYANTEQNKCIQKGVTFLSYEDPLGMALALMAFCFSAFTAVVLCVFVKHHDTPIVKANNRSLSYMLVFCSVWVTFLPVYHSTKGKVMVAVEIFSILASSAGMLGCIFVPKIYIMLMRPERNCTQKIREKSYF